MNPLLDLLSSSFGGFVCLEIGGFEGGGSRERRGYFIIRAHSHIFLTETHVKIKGCQLHWITTPSQVSTEEGVP